MIYQIQSSIVCICRYLVCSYLYFCLYCILQVASKMGFSLFWQPATLFREQKFLSLLMKQETMRQQWH